MSSTDSLTIAASKPRIDWLDTIRFLACFMVIIAHCIDPYVFTSDGHVSGFAGYMVSAMRPCVPFFMMLSGALLLPMRGTSGNFFKRRFTRVLFPFLIWSVAYALFPIPTGPAEVFGTENQLAQWVTNPAIYNLLMIPINFTSSNVHFWFIFVLLGLYLFIPVLSPWVEKAPQKSLITFLAIWGFTLFLPYIHFFAFKEIHGECTWNAYGMLHPFAGYIGYLLLGYFLMKYNTLSLKKALLIGIPLFITGLLITRFGFLWTVEHAVDRSRDIELFVGTLTPNVVMMTIGLFIIFQKINFKGKVQRAIQRLSELSYGIFLVHYIISLWVMAYIAQFRAETLSKVYHRLFDATGWEWLGWVAMNQNEVLPMIEIPMGAVIVLLIATMITLVLSKLPKSKYLIG